MTYNIILYVILFKKTSSKGNKTLTSTSIKCLLEVKREKSAYFPYCLLKGKYALTNQAFAVGQSVASCSDIYFNYHSR